MANTDENNGWRFGTNKYLSAFFSWAVTSQRVSGKSHRELHMMPVFSSSRGQEKLQITIFSHNHNSCRWIITDFASEQHVDRDKMCGRRCYIYRRRSAFFSEANQKTKRISADVVPTFHFLFDCKQCHKTDRKHSQSFTQKDRRREKGPK